MSITQATLGGRDVTDHQCKAALTVAPPDDSLSSYPSVSVSWSSLAVEVARPAKRKLRPAAGLPVT